MNQKFQLLQSYMFAKALYILKIYNKNINNIGFSFVFSKIYLCLFVYFFLIQFRKVCKWQTFMD